MGGKRVKAYYFLFRAAKERKAFPAVVYRVVAHILSLHETAAGSAAAALARGSVYAHRCALCDPHTIDVLDVLYHVV